jgi:hypothetical protein
MADSFSGQRTLGDSLGSRGLILLSGKFAFTNVKIVPIHGGFFRGKNL